MTADRKAKPADKKAGPADETKTDVQGMLTKFGVAAICDMILDGKLLREIARELGIKNHAPLVKWIAADKERAKQVEDARRLAAFTYDEMASELIRNAADRFELDKAKEEAHHLRWRASKMNPKFGDKMAIGGAEDLPPLKALDDAALEARIKQLQEKMSGSSSR